MIRTSLLPVLLVAVGCATPSTTVLSLSDASCAGCGAGVVGKLKKIEGVEAASFDKDKVEVTVVHDKETAPTQVLVAALQGGDYAVKLGAGKGSYQGAPEFTEDMDVAFINEGGADVDPAVHLAAGKVTVVDYWAEWCGPCKDVDRAMIKVLAKRSDVALRKVDVKDWASPVAKNRLSRIKSLPYVEVYGPDGKQRDAIVGKDLPRLLQAIGAPPTP